MGKNGLDIQRYKGMPYGSITQTTNVTRDTKAFAAAFTAEPDGLEQNLPPGLSLHPNNRAQLSMYQVQDPFDTTHVEPYTITYLAIEVAGHDTEMISENDGVSTHPGRFFARYWTSSLDIALMKRESRGIPARIGLTEWERDSSLLTSTLYVEEQPIITLSAEVQEQVVDQVRGHLNYYTRRQIPSPSGPICEIDELVEIPIPVILDMYQSDDSTLSIEFTEEEHSAGEIETLRPTSVEAVRYSEYSMPHYPAGYVIKDYLADYPS